MNSLRYIIRSVVHYRRQHLALFFSMAVGAAVLTGALVVGDSIRYSLSEMVDARLGKTRFSISSGSRFMDSDLAHKLSAKLNVPATPLLSLKGIAINQATQTNAGNVAVNGIDTTFSRMAGTPFPFPGDDEAIIGKGLADRLGLKTGDELLARVESVSSIPVNSPFARELKPTVALRLTVKEIANDDQLGRFNLGNDQSVALNIFVSKRYLCRKLGLENLSNTILIAGQEGENTQDGIIDALRSVWSLKDMSLSFKGHDNDSSFDLFSGRIFLDTVVQHIVRRSGLRGEEITSYLVNDISHNGKHIPYSFATALSPAITEVILNPGEAIINRWSADDLGAEIGDSIHLTYFVIGKLREISEAGHSFVIKSIISNATSRVDSTLMPAFPGLSGAKDCNKWDAGVPVDFKRIRDKDEKYWDDYRGTPKVILSPGDGFRLWENQFGAVTAIRFSKKEVTEAALESHLLKTVVPADLGIQVFDVRNEGINAASNAVDFTSLFLGLSFFVIVAGIMLTLLIYSLHFSQRSQEAALLNALGYSARRIVRLRIGETAAVIVTGSVAGALLGIAYNYAILNALNGIWNDIVRTNMLLVHIKGWTLILGAVISMLLALLPLYFITMKRLRDPLSGQLRGNDSSMNEQAVAHNRKGFFAGVGLIGVSLIIVAYSLLAGQLDAPVPYLSSAALFLAGGIMLARGVLKNELAGKTEKVPGTVSLAIRNLGRNSARSLSVITLLAIGSFTILITGSYRKTFLGSELIRKSGTGGYMLWAETTSPVPFDLNSSEGRDRLLTDGAQDLDSVRFLQFARLEGDEASCLNLNLVQRPRLLAVDPQPFDSTGAFSFVRLLKGVSRTNPWPALDKPLDDSTFAAFADQDVIHYSLKKNIGDTLFYLGENGKTLRLVLTGSLINSVFQGSFLVSEKVLREYYPSSRGSKTILVDCPAHKTKLISDILERSLTDYGIEVSTAGDRLAVFNSVVNTYLTVFMILSGLGFLIGTIGLGIVLLRNIFERRREIAIMQAIGYSRARIFSIVFTENIILLASGFFIGLMAALAGILPSLLSPSFSIEGNYLVYIIAIVFMSGLLWIYIPLRLSLRKPVLQSLRSE